MEIDDSRPLYLNIELLNTIISDISKSNDYAISKQTCIDYQRVIRSSTLDLYHHSITNRNSTIRTTILKAISKKDKAMIVKLTFLALDDFIRNKHLSYYEYSLLLIHIFFKQGFFNDNEVYILFCYIIRLTINTNTNDNHSYISSAFEFLSDIFSILSLNTESHNKGNENLIKRIANFLSNLSHNDIMFSKLYALNLYSLFQYDKDDFSTLMTPIYKFITDISLFHYDTNMFNSFISTLINQFGKDHSTKVPSNILLFIKEMIEREFDIRVKDEYHFLNQFHFNDNQSKGISLLDLTFPNKPYTLIFSFKSLTTNNCNDSSNKGCILIPLITFTPNSNDIKASKAPLMVYTNDQGKLCLTLHSTINTDITIQSNKSYVVVISQNNNLFNIQVNNTKLEYSNSKMGSLKGEKCVMNIGGVQSIGNSNNAFNGYIGTVILYSNYFTSEMIQELNKLKGKYDLVLICNQLLTQLNSTVSINSKALEYFNQKKQMEHLIAVISPQYLNSAKLSHQHQSQHSLTQIKVKGLECLIDTHIHPHQLKLTLDEFLKLEGLRFLQLTIEYNQQLLDNIKVAKTNILLQSIANELKVIFSLIKLILELADPAYFLNKESSYNSLCTFIDLPLKEIKHNSNDIIFLFGSYTNIILSIAFISPQHIETNLNELLAFISVCAFQEDSNELLFTLKTKLIYFFLYNKSLYESTNSNYCTSSESNNTRLSKVVKTINDCLSKNSKGLLNIGFLMAMLTFSDEVIEGYGGMLRTYLEICFEQSPELFIYFLYIIANEEKDMGLLVKMLLTLFAFCSNLPIQESKSVLMKVYLDKLIRDKLNQVNTLSMSMAMAISGNTGSQQAYRIAIGIAVLIQLIRFVTIDTKEISNILKKMNMNSEIIFRSIMMFLYQSITTEEFLTTINNNTEFNKVIISSKTNLIDSNLEFWFEMVIKCYMKIDNEEIKAIAYNNIIGLIEKQISTISSSNSSRIKEDNIGKLYHILHSKNILTKFFYWNGLNEVCTNDLIRISKAVIDKHPKPFVFSLLFKFYVQSKVKGVSNKPQLQLMLNKTLPNKEDNSYLADTEPVSIDQEDTHLKLKIEDDSMLFIDKPESKSDMPYSSDNHIDHLSNIVNSLLLYMVNQLITYTKDSNTNTDIDIVELQKNILVNNINLYIFLYKVFCLQKSSTEDKKKLKLFKAIETNLIINSNNFYFYSLPFLRISFPIGAKQTKFVLEILFDLYNEFLLLTDNQKYYGYFTSYVTFDLLHTSFLYEADMLLMNNTLPTRLNINQSQFLQLESLMALIPKLHRQEISLTMYYLIKFSIVLLKDESVNYKLHSDLRSFIGKLVEGLFNETQMLFASVKKMKGNKGDYNEKYYARIKKELIDKRKWKMNDYESYLSKMRIKEKEDMDRVYCKVVFNKRGMIVTEEMMMKKETKSFMFGRASIDSIPRKLSGEEDIYTPPLIPASLLTSNSNSNTTQDINANNTTAKEAYTQLLKDFKFDLNDKCNYFLFNFPICNLKKTLLHIVFGYQFRNILFYDKGFIDLIKEFKSVFSNNLFYTSHSPNTSPSPLPYPTKLKNYSINHMRLFLKPAMTYLYKNPQIVGVAYRNLHYHSTSITKLKHFKNQLHQVTLPNKIISYWGELITIEGTSFGLISLSKNYIQFKAYCDKDPRQPNTTTTINDQDRLKFVLSSLESDVLIQTKLILFRYSDIKLLFKKRYIYSMIASEFFLLNGRSFFFNLFTEEQNIAFLSSINTIANKTLINLSLTVVDRLIINDIPNKWLRKEITTFEYLLLLNITSRSFNDCNQYPVFPWLEVKGDNECIVQRDFEYALSVQDAVKRKKVLMQYDNMTTSFKNHFNTHYSTASFVIYYLIRLNPFTYNMIKLQNGIFDLPGRLFHSYDEILTILQQFNDNRELVPEVFYLPEMFLNLNYYNYGSRQHDEVQIHNVLLITGNGDSNSGKAQMNPVAFALRYRKMLDSPQIVSNIHKWIDNVFGVNQLNTNTTATNKGSCNVYMKFCYEEHMNLIEKINKMNKSGMDPKEIWTKVRTKIQLILNFGQTPQRVFKDKHPIALIANEEYINSTPGNNSSSIAVLSIPKEFLCCKEIVNNGKQKAIVFISKDKELYDDTISFDKLFMKPKKFTFEYIITYIDNTKGNKRFYRGQNLFELFNTSIGPVCLFCNYNDNSIKFYCSILNETYEYIMESFVTSIEKINEKQFITGDINGKVIIWEFDYSQLSNANTNTNANKSTTATNMNLIRLKSFLQHSPITLIVYSQSLNIILTADKQGHICIRSLITLELLNLISPKGESHKRSLIIANIAISKYNYVYISGYDSCMKEFYLMGYTLNGVLFSKTKMLTMDFQFMPNDTILIFGRGPENNKPRFLSVNPSDLKEVLYYNNSPTVNQISHFILSIEKRYIYLLDYRYDKLHIALLSDEDVNNYCYKPF